MVHVVNIGLTLLNHSKTRFLLWILAVRVFLSFTCDVQPCKVNGDSKLWVNGCVFVMDWQSVQVVPRCSPGDSSDWLLLHKAERNKAGLENRWILNLDSVFILFVCLFDHILQFVLFYISFIFRWNRFSSGSVGRGYHLNIKRFFYALQLFPCK